MRVVEKKSTTIRFLCAIEYIRAGAQKKNRSKYWECFQRSVKFDYIKARLELHFAEVSKR